MELVIKHQEIAKRISDRPEIFRITLVNQSYLVSWFQNCKELTPKAGECKGLW